MKTVNLSVLKRCRSNGRARKKRKLHVSFSWEGGGFLCGLVPLENYEADDALPLEEVEEAWRESLPPGLCVGCKKALKKRLQAGPLAA